MKPISPRTNSQLSPPEQHSPARSLALHLAPGILVGAAYFALRPLLDTWGYPSLMALMLAVPLVLVPLELGYLLYQGRKRNGRLSLQGVVMYRNPIPLWQYFAWAPLLFVLIGLIFTVMKPIDALLQQLFAWIPVMESGLQAGFSQTVLIRTYLMVAVFGVVAGPVVEELYFRGYLLPRMGYARKWAPLLHSFLFAIYHIWTPWMLLTRTLGMLPLIFAVQRRNLYLGMVVHTMINVVDVIVGVSVIVGMSRLA